ncbi:hypothetical protein DY000_02013349 [Brassica cretica]|uniref:Uncharacterized protein n=1 Tax=Brassica cretica TaxID=69181 RepID=A0ABQ7CWM4_BRACR|nr:hypothetical protein DY000_02013349 [Brassica cretica]
MDLRVKGLTTGRNRPTGHRLATAAGTATATGWLRLRVYGPSSRKKPPLERIESCRTKLDSDDVAHRSSKRGDEHGNRGDDLDQRFRGGELRRVLELVRLWATCFDRRSATAASGEERRRRLTQRVGCDRGNEEGGIAETRRGRERPRNGEGDSLI